MTTIAKTFQLTQKHCDTGIRRNCARCPVALAIEAAYPVRIGPDPAVSVGERHAAWQDKNQNWHHLYFADSLRIKIVHFDKTGIMTPCTIAEDGNAHLSVVS